MKKGDAIEVQIIRGGLASSTWMPATVCETRRNHMTQEITSVRVRWGERVCWVQVRFVREVMYAEPA